MSQRLLVLLLGMVIGGGLAFGALRLRVPAAHPEQAQDGNGNTALLEKLDRATERIAELEGERWLRPSEPGSNRTKEEVFRESQERKAEALSEVLTPEQLQSYRSLQELESALMKRNPRRKRADNDSKPSQP